MSYAMIWRRDDVAEKEDALFAERVKGFIEMFDGELKVADAVELFLVDLDADIAIFIGDNDQGVREQRGKLLN